jgi:hypothetical protein
MTAMAITPGMLPAIARTPEGANNVTSTIGLIK